MLFINTKIKKLRKAGYMVLTPEQTNEHILEIDKLRKHDKRVTKKYNNLLKDIVLTLTMKEMKEQLATAGVTETPNKKAELIDLYVTTFEE